MLFSMVRGLLLVGHATFGEYLYAHFLGFLCGVYVTLCMFTLWLGPYSLARNLQLLLMPCSLSFVIVWVYLRVLRAFGLREGPPGAGVVKDSLSKTKTREPSIRQSISEYD